LKVSRAIVAASIFLAINIAIPASANLKGRGASISGDTIQMALRQAQQKLALESTKEPPVVFIGSSLIIAPLWSTDVKHGYFYQDCMLHHQSKALEDLLKKDGITAPVVSLATAGQFVSDAYLIIDKLIAGNSKGGKNGDGKISDSKNPAQKEPLALIYGIAPRDFMDDTTGGLALTSVFDELVDLSDLPKVGNLFFSTFDERTDFLLNRSVYMYRKRGRYQNKIELALEKTLARALPNKGQNPNQNLLNQDLNKDPNKSPGLASADGDKTGPVDPLAGFLLGGNRNDIWTKSIAEYSRRYKFFNKQQFEKQKECFKAVVSLCKERGIKLYVVAMPITDDNRKLMPRELYSSYIDCISTTTRDAGVPFLDLQKDGAYKNDDFYDTVHLNGIGGERFLSAMSSIVKGAAGADSGIAAGSGSEAASIAAKKPSSPTY